MSLRDRLPRQLSHIPRPTPRQLVRAGVVIALCSVLVPIATAGTVIASYLFLPLPANIPAPHLTPASNVTRLYDVNLQQQIGTFRAFETNIPVQPKDIPDVLKQAVVATEDRRFFNHGGVDPEATLRAMWADIRSGSVVQGGSTITQQYVKNAYIGKERTLTRKVREAVLAAQVDRQLPKDQILYQYLSTIYFGSGAYGVGAASQTYFRKPVSQVSLSEAALIAALIRAPSYYEPRSNPTAAEERRVLVLGKMLAEKQITPEQYDKAVNDHLVVLNGNAPPPKGPATVVYPPEQEPVKYPYFVDYVRRYLTAKYGPEKVFRGGLRIQTTIDPNIQDLAERTVADALSGTKPPLDMALASVEPGSGRVQALVGGRDFNQSQVNLALGRCPPPNGEPVPPDEPVCIEGGGTGRQPGSAFKPFTLAKAFEEGMTPDRSYPAPHSYTYPKCGGVGCTVSNVEGEGGGSMDLRSATWHSVNTVYAQLIQDVGVKSTAELAHRMGITMVGSDGKDPRRGTPYGPSLTLGTAEVSPLDMAGAYAVFASKGEQFPPTPVVKVIDNSGKVLEDNTKPASKRVLDAAIATNVTDVLRGVIERGTGTSANINRPAAGKTGTTENFGNAWFCGFTPALSTAVWMGYADAPKPMHGIKGVGSVYGGTIPAETWHNFMSAALKDVPPSDFDQPPPLKPVSVDLKKLARGGFDLGYRRYPKDTDPGGPYQYNLPPPRVAAPPPVAVATTTTTAVPPDFFGTPETTTTTRPRGLIGGPP